VDDDVGILDGGLHERLVTHVSSDEVERWLGAEVKEALLTHPIHEIVEGFHSKAGTEQMLAEDTAEITKTPCDQDTLRHGLLQRSFGSRRTHTAVRTVRPDVDAA
jgi:hypothetical protein